MGASEPGLDVAALIDDRIGEGVFRVDRQVYRDESLFALEMECIFESNWVYLCHESQVREPGSYFTTHAGRQPVFVLRQKDGSLGAFLNACPHRGSLLLPLRQGKVKSAITCRFHGWVFSPAGKCVKIKQEDSGAYPGGVAGRDALRSAFDLTPLARTESYRGFLFGSFKADVEPLSDYLGQAKAFIDLIADQSPGGMEVLRGSSTYTCRHNWKMQLENVTDGYHVSTVHRAFGTTMLNREARGGWEGLLTTEKGRIQGVVKNGSYDLGHGHLLVWADRSTPEGAPLYPEKARIEKTFPPGKAKWMLDRGRNLNVFPNLVLNDLASTHLRTHRPISAERTEVTIWCIAPVGETAEARYARLRKFEDFFLVTGMATSDDLISLNVAHEGSRATARRWNDFLRGMGDMRKGADDAARELGVEPAMSSPSWDHETQFHGLYRYWASRLASGSASGPGSGPA